MGSNTNFLRNICKCGLFTLGLCTSGKLQSQNIDAPRFFKLNFQNLGSPNRLISPEGNPQSVNDSESSYILESQLRFPISLKGHTQLIGQLDYDREVVFGLYSYDETEGEDFNFQNIGASVIAIHRIDPKWSFFSRLKIESGNERLFPLHRQAFNGSYSNFVERKIENGSVGLGFQGSYNRRFSVLPVIRYQKSLPSGWGIDISLPQQILINKQFSESHRWYAGLKGTRSNYMFRDELQDISNGLYYRRITVNAIIGLEKQLTPLFGLMVEAGATRPLRSAVYSYEGQWQKIHDFNESISPYVKFGLFLSINRADI